MINGRHVFMVVSMFSAVWMPMVSLYSVDVNGELVFCDGLDANGGEPVLGDDGELVLSDGDADGELELSGLDANGELVPCGWDANGGDVFCVFDVLMVVSLY